MTQNTNNILKKKLDEFLGKNIARKFDSFNPLNVTKVLQTLYFFVKFVFLSCVSLRVVI